MEIVFLWSIILLPQDVSFARRLLYVTQGRVLSIYMKFFIRLKHMKIVAEIFVLPRKMSFEFCGHHS